MPRCPALATGGRECGGDLVEEGGMVVCSTCGTVTEDGAAVHEPPLGAAPGQAFQYDQPYSQQKELTKPQRAAYDKIALLVTKLSLPNSVTKQAQWAFRQLVLTTKFASKLVALAGSCVFYVSRAEHHGLLLKTVQAELGIDAKQLRKTSRQADSLIAQLRGEELEAHTTSTTHIIRRFAERCVPPGQGVSAAKLADRVLGFVDAESLGAGRSPQLIAASAIKLARDLRHLQVTSGSSDSAWAPMSTADVARLCEVDAGTLGARTREILRAAQQLVQCMELDLGDVGALAYVLDHHSALRELSASARQGKRGAGSAAATDADRHIRKRRLYDIANSAAHSEGSIGAKAEPLDARDSAAVVVMKRMVLKGWDEDSIVRSDVDELSQPTVGLFDQAAGDTTLSEATLELDIPDADFSFYVKPSAS